MALQGMLGLHVILLERSALAKEGDPALLPLASFHVDESQQSILVGGKPLADPSHLHFKMALPRALVGEEDTVADLCGHAERLLQRHVLLRYANADPTLEWIKVQTVDGFELFPSLPAFPTLDGVPLFYLVATYQASTVPKGTKRPAPKKTTKEDEAPKADEPVTVAKAAKDPRKKKGEEVPTQTKKQRMMTEEEQAQLVHSMVMNLSTQPPQPSSLKEQQPQQQQPQTEEETMSKQQAPVKKAPAKKQPVTKEPSRIVFLSF